jgi:hypothetical protein
MANDTLGNAAQPGSPEMRKFAAAWIDRFEALGGYFGYVRNADGSVKNAAMGYPMPYVWQPPKLHNPKLSPCDCIIEESQHEGAVKMLMSFLALVPGLRTAVYDLAEEYGAVLS